MKGKILAFDNERQEGVISGDDGSRYNFKADQVSSTTEPKAGNKVDFRAEGDDALDIYVEQFMSSGISKKLVAALFAFFLGSIGAHKFYLGYTKQGIIMLLACLLGIVLLGIPTIIVSLIAFIEFIIYLTKSDEEFELLYVQGRKNWF